MCKCSNGELTGGYIVLPENSDAKLIAAADTLERYLARITGKSYPVKNNGMGIKFELGFTTEIADNGYIIKTLDNVVSIKGSGTRGLIHGVYGFLEKYCGCDWYTKDVISVPENKNLTFKQDETKYEPFFEYTETDWSSGDLEFSLANGLTGGTFRKIPDEFGGTVSYISSDCHTLTNQFCSKSKYFQSHPEYFALHDGERNPGQLCLTNEKVYEIVRDEVFELLKKYHNPDEYLQIVSLTQADNGEMCQCEKCKAVDNTNGSHAGTMITFVNRIARDVKAAGYSNVAIDTFAYQHTVKAPTQVVPDDNVIVRFCTISLDFSLAIDDSSSSNNAIYVKHFEDWRKICNRLYVWDYTTNYKHSISIFPDFGVMQRNVQFFYEHNAKGVYEEGNYYLENSDGEFSDLRRYLIAKLLQNPYIDYYKTMEKFLNVFYGKAGPYIKSFIDMTIKKPTNLAPERRLLSIYNYMKSTLGFDADDINKADELWENAKKAVSNDEAYLKRVLRSEMCWRYWKLFHTIDTERTVQFINYAKLLTDSDFDDINKETELWESAKKAESNEELYRKLISRSEMCWVCWKFFHTIDIKKTNEFIKDAKAMGIFRLSEDGDGSETSANYIDTLYDKIVYDFEVY